MLPKYRTISVGLVALLAICYFQVNAAHGISAFTGNTTVNPSGFSNLIANPDDYFSWDLTNITYSFDSSFTSNNQIRDQIRLAFNQWDTANGTADGSTYSYFRDVSSQPFGDIRSIAVHEIGHVMGLHHPNQADGFNRNYGLTGGGGLVVQADQNNEVMRSFINPGDYNHALSHDELDGFDYFYGHDLNFTEVASGGNIVIQSASLGSSSTWAEGGPSGFYRTGNHLEGVRSTGGTVTFNTTSSTALGFKTLGINWDFQNVSGSPTSSFEIITRGTNNPTPISRYDGFPANRFNSYSSSAVSANAKDDLKHVWSNPTGGPFPGIVHVGLEQDVWDWTVVSAQVVNPDNTKTNAPLLSFHDWNQTVTGVAATTTAAVSDTHGITFEDPIILGRGIRLVNSLNTPSEIVELAFANVEGMNLKLDELNQETMQQLAREQRLEFIPLDQLTMDDGEQLLLLMDGKSADFPGRVISLDRPDLLETELFVFAKSQIGEAIVGNYALLGRDPILGVAGQVGDPLVGDTDRDGDIDGTDLSNFASGWFGPGGAGSDGISTSIIEWGIGNFDADNDVDGTDLGGFASGWYGPNGSGYVPTASAVPEPSIIVMLILGTLCLVGYRVRK